VPAAKFLQFAAQRAPDPAEQSQLADDVLADLGKWGPGEWPQRPAVLTWDDGQIVMAHRKQERGDKLKKDEREQLSFFGAWRGAIYKQEADNAGKLKVLLRLHCYLESSERFEDLRQLREFVRDWYHMPLPEVVPQSMRWQDAACDRYCQNRHLLPVWLRGMTRPPAGHETATSGKPEEPAAPPPPQQSLGFVEEW
jgi:hypothetical protein